MIVLTIATDIANNSITTILIFLATIIIIDNNKNKNKINYRVNIVIIVFFHCFASFVYCFKSPPHFVRIKKRNKKIQSLTM